MRLTTPALVALLACAPGAAPAEAAAPDFVVHSETLADAKAVFATVESREIDPARVRTGGTIAQIAVRRGEAVHRGQLIATVGDMKLVMQRGGLNAEIAALRAQLAQTKADLARTETLVVTGAATRQLRDQTRTQVQVETSTIQAKTSQLQVVEQQLTEGEVLSPADGRVLDLPFTEGTVVTPGEAVATVAVAGYVLRLRVPEEHARFLKPGGPIRLDGADLAQGADVTGQITLVYPQIQDGRVIAEAQVPGLGDYFVGQRVRVWLAGAPRPRVVVPGHMLRTAFGLDYVMLRTPDGVIQAPVQRGIAAPGTGMPDGVEILSGLTGGETLVSP